RPGRFRLTRPPVAPRGGAPTPHQSRSAVAAARPVPTPRWPPTSPGKSRACLTCSGLRRRLAGDGRPPRGRTAGATPTAGRAMLGPIPPPAEGPAMTEETLFALALEKSGGAERRAFLDAACGGDLRLRYRVEQLLAADERSPGILEEGPGAAAVLA